MKVLKYLLFIVCLYFYIFNPIFRVLGFGVIKLLLFVSIIYLIFNKGSFSSFKYFKKEIILTIILIAYSLPLVMLGNGTALMIPYQHVVWFLECFFIPVFLLSFFKNIFQKQSWESSVVIVGTIASLITLHLIINPETNIWVRESVIIDSLDSFATTLYFRGFSLAESSAFGYGVAQGLILSFCLFSMRKSFLYALPIIPLLVAILFNARVGFSVVVIALVLLIISNRIRFKGIITIVILVYAIILFVTNSTFISDNLRSLEWGLSFFDDTFSFFKGNASDSNYDVLLNSMLFFPTSLLGIIFGEGRSVYGIIDGSDIGYVNQIFTGGIIYLLIMLYFLWYMYKRNLKYATDKLYPTLFIITLIIANFKGSVFFVSHSFFRLFTLYYIYCIFIADGKIIQPADKGFDKKLA